MKYLLLALLLPALLTSAAQPVDTVLVELDEVVVSAGYIAETTAPIAYQNVPMQTLVRKNTGQEPSFILAEQAGITAYSDGGSGQGYSYFRMRGIDQTRIAMTLDGVPLNEPEDQGVYFSNYPDFFSNIGGLQIQRGVGTSKNGASGFGGSLQFTSPVLHRPRALALGAGYGAFNSYRAFAELNTGVHRNKALYLRGVHIHSDGYKTRSAHSSQSLFYSTGRFGTRSTLKLTGFVGRQQNELAWLGVPAQAIRENPRTNANGAEDDAFVQQLTQLQHILTLGERGTLRSSVFYNYLDGNYDFDLNNFLGISERGELYNYAFRSYFTGGFSNYTHDWGRLGQLTGGVYANTYSRRHTGSERSAGELYQNTGFRREASAFLKGQIQARKWVFYADAQYRYSDFAYRGDVAFPILTWRFFNPKAGISYIANKRLTAYVSAGINHREPTRNNISGGSDNLLSDSLGAPLLYITQPEKVIDQTVGLRYRYARGSLDVTAYYMRFTNEIVLNGQFGTNGLALNSDVDNSYRMGLEIAATHHWNERWSVQGNMALNRSRIATQGIVFQPILTPKVLLNAAVLYAPKRWEMGADLRYQSSAYIDFANANTIDGFFVANAQIAYRPSKWRFGLHVNNLTNTTYFSSGYTDFDGVNKYFVQAPAHVNTTATRTF